MGSPPSDVAAAGGRLRTARFSATRTLDVGGPGASNQPPEHLTGAIDRPHRRSTLTAVGGAGTGQRRSEYRVIGNTAYVRFASGWAKQDLNRRTPVSILYTIASGAIFSFPLDLVDPLKKEGGDTVGGTRVTRYSARVDPKVDPTGGTGTLNQPILIWLDAQHRMRRLQFSSSSEVASTDPSTPVHTSETVQIEFTDLNKPVTVIAPRHASG